MRQSAAVFLGAAFLFLIAVQSASAEKSDNELSGYLIRKITIIREDVFDLSDPKESGKVGQVGNAIHPVTKEKIIKNELLFKEGDVYDKLNLEESERNLRKYDFLTQIWIKAIPDHANKTVDITVHTRDQWSLIIGGTAGGTNENPQSGIDIGEKNLFGHGQTLNYRYRSSNSGSAHSFGFKDATVFDTRYALELGYDFTGSEDKYEVIIQKPFYSLSAKNSQGGSFTYQKRSVDGLEHFTKRSNLFFGWSSKFREEDILRTTLHISGGELTSKDKGKTVSIVRDNKILLQTVFLFEPYRFEKDTYIYKFRQVEDIPMGWEIQLLTGKRFFFLGSTTNEFSGGAIFKKKTKLRSRDYFFSMLEARMNDNDFNNRFYSADFQYFWRDMDSQTVVFHSQFKFLDSDVNLVSLGGTEGLRGFKTEEFEGKGLVAVNIEDRIFTYESIFYGIFEPGFVVFTDWGNTWNRVGEDNIVGLNGSVGVGLRLALLKAPGINLIRADLGVPVTRGSSPVLTIGMEGFF